MLKGTGVSKLTIYFRVKLVNLFENHCKLKKSSLSLNILKNYTKSNKQVWRKVGMNLNSLYGAKI